MVATEDGRHHHFTVAELRAVLEPSFEVDRVARTGLGLQELVNLALLMVQVRGRAPNAARLLMALHLLVYVLDDMIPAGRFGYHLAVRARRHAQGGRAMSARVLFCCWPFEGHVFPQLSMALALRERGNEVAFYTGSRLQETIEQEGVRVFPFAKIEPAWLAVQERERQVGGRRQSLRVEHQAFREWLVETIPDQVKDLRSIISEWQADVLVTDASMWGPSLVLNEAVPIPVALASPLITAVIPGPGAPPQGSGLPPAHNARTRARAWAITSATQLLAGGLRRRVDELRAAEGLPAMGCGVNERCGQLPLYMVLSVAELDFNRRDLPPSVHYVGACTWHPPEPAGTSEWLDQLPGGRPWVHVTEGTSHYQDPFLLRAAVSGLAGAPLEAIITHGRNRGPKEMGLGPAAPNVHMAPWLSHDALLPRCEVLVTTGGAGTVIAGLQAGVPLVIVPTTWDKPDNARRVVAAGAGVILPSRKCTPQSLRAAVEGVLAQPRYRAAAQRCAELLARAPGPSGAAELIEALAPRKRERDRQAEPRKELQVKTLSRGEATDERSTAGTRPAARWPERHDRRGAPRPNGESPPSPRTASANTKTPMRGRWAGSRAGCMWGPAATCSASKTRRPSSMTGI